MTRLASFGFHLVGRRQGDTGEGNTGEDTGRRHPFSSYFELLVKVIELTWCVR